jgi:hypothetical protein
VACHTTNCQLTIFVQQDVIIDNHGETWHHPHTLLLNCPASHTASTFCTSPTDSGGTLNTCLPIKLYTHIKPSENMQLPQFLKHGFWQNIISTKRKSASSWGKYVKYGMKGPRDWVAGDMSHIHEDQEFVFRDIKKWGEVCMYVYLAQYL